jgi:Putative adhesin
MTATSRPPVLEHAIGATGQLSIRLGVSEAHLRATDGDTVRVYLDHDEFHRSFDVVATPGSLSLRAGHGLILSGIRRRPEVSRGLVIDVPARATVLVETTAGSVRIEGLMGDQRYRSTAGDIILRDVGGSVTVEAVSGDVELTTVGTASLMARTISGDLRARSATISSLRLSTTNGDIKFAGRLSGTGPFRVDTVSGDSLLALAGDAVVEVASAAGRVRTDLELRTSSGPTGKRTLTIGRGGPTLTVSTLSGDVRLVPPVAVPAPDGSEGITVEHAAAAEPEPTHAARLAILGDLERGEIDPDEAGRRLDALDGDV